MNISDIDISSFYDKLINFSEKNQKKVKIEIEYIKEIYKELFKTQYYQSITDWSKLPRILEELKKKNLIRIPKSDKLYEYTTKFKIPKYITICIQKRKLNDKPWKTYLWHPEIDFAQHMESYSQFEKMKKIDTFLKNKSNLIIPISEKERSLQIFGDEKILSSFVNNISIKQTDIYHILKCYKTYEPLMGFNFPKCKTNKIIFIENRDTFFNLSKVCYSLKNPPYRDVYYGQGINFQNNILSLPFYCDSNSIIEYFGDIDYSGFSIPIKAQKNLKLSGHIYKIQLASILYDNLIQIHQKCGFIFHSKEKEKDLDDILETLSSSTQKIINIILREGNRVPQELLNLVELYKCFSQDPIPETFFEDHQNLARKLYLECIHLPKFA